MFQWLLNQLEKHDRKYTIYDRENVEPYLTRYYVAWADSTKRERKDIPFNTFLHQFLRSDDPVFHTHPWDWYFTIVLKGGYWQHTPWGTKWMGPGSWHYQDCTTWRSTDESHDVRVPANLHWVEIPKPGKTWTSFTRGKTINNAFWGFCPNLETGEIIYHEDYLASQRRSRDVLPDQTNTERQLAS
jgi:hypothetical protein